MSTPSLLDHPLLEPVLQRRAARRALAYTDAARARMAPHVALARAQYRAALELRDVETLVVAFGLLRDAARGALRALEHAREGASISPSPEAAWDQFSAQSERADAPPTFERVRAVLATKQDDLAAFVDALADPHELRVEAERTVAWLLELPELRTPAQIARARLVRSTLFVLALVAITWGLVGYWLALSALAPPERSF